MRKFDIEKFNQDGFTIIDDLISKDTIESLLQEINNAPQTNAVKRKNQQVYAIRDLLNVIPTVEKLAASSDVKKLVEWVIGKAVVTRGILFDKIPVANWMVDWHQDLIVAVKESKAVEGFQNWSVKSGITHVMPPVAILERMLTVRIHLDDVDESNGALLVIPGSHKFGYLRDDKTEALKSQKKVLCSASKGGALLMRPLLLHSSHAGNQPFHRRVIHLEYSPDILPGGLEWYGA
ncbi:MAG: phytanoyl-CoA dioxygenase family protein [Acidobacteriota bacterium]